MENLCTEKLKFVSFVSSIEPVFWHTFAKIKLDELGLCDDALDIYGYFSHIANQSKLPLFNLYETSFVRSELTGHVLCHGKMMNKNTIEAFRNCDKRSLLAETGRRIWCNIVSGRVKSNPNLLFDFLLLTYADLKTYKFIYWFAFPALNIPGVDYFVRHYFSLESKSPSLYSCLRSATVAMTTVTSSSTSISVDAPFFWLDNVSIADTEFTDARIILDPTASTNPGSLVLVVCDPWITENCDDSVDSTMCVGWPFRNVLCYAWFTCWQYLDAAHRHVRVLALRDNTSTKQHSRNARVASSDSRHADISMRYSSSVMFLLHIVVAESVAMVTGDETECPCEFTGWLMNDRGRMMPQCVSLASQMDPNVYYQSCVDLNTKLMKWRQLPQLDVDVIKRTRCLLCGAGTLGCNIARVLLAWGFQHFTFVDSGHVSCSNPVRQTLYTCADALAGRPKAETAAERLRDILPSAVSSGYSLRIHCPGTPVSATELTSAVADLHTLRRLIDECDVVFLLTDSRESRWLPTVMSIAAHKIVINVALGFDSYLVMRHGCRHSHDDQISASHQTTAESDHSITGQSHITSSFSQAAVPSQNSAVCGSGLGCYFCCDIVTPCNSLVDRSLDQQCTVTRPGLSYIASGYAVELCVSLLQHPDRCNAPVWTSGFCEDPCSPLGAIPHSIRGFLSLHQLFYPCTAAFDRCSACSESVIGKYLERGNEFLLNVFNQSDYLMQVTGLDELMQKTHSFQLTELDSDSDHS